VTSRLLLRFEVKTPGTTGIFTSNRPGGRG